MGNESNTPMIQAAPVQAAPQMVIPTQALYMNSFRVGYTTADVFIVLQHNGSDVAVLNVSYTLAKTLGEALHKLIEQLESKTGQTIMTAHTILQATSKPPKEETL